MSAQGIPFTCFLNVATVEGGINSSALAMFVAKRESRGVDWSQSNPDFFSKWLAKLQQNEISMLREYQGPYIARDDLPQLDRNPLATFADHLRNHWFMPALTTEKLVTELDGSHNDLRGYSSYRKFLAVPHGVISPDQIGLIMSLGYDAIFANQGWGPDSPIGIYPRVDMNERINTRVKFFGAIFIANMRRISFFR
jgi:peptidoglycan/xylan/chitin deacetylase (PgdA/CDA1 family)